MKPKWPTCFVDVNFHPRLSQHVGVLKLAVKEKTYTPDLSEGFQFPPLYVCLQHIIVLSEIFKTHNTVHVKRTMYLITTSPRDHVGQLGRNFGEREMTSNYNHHVKSY